MFKNLCYVALGLTILGTCAYSDGDTAVAPENASEAPSTEVASPVHNTEINPQADSTAPLAQSPEHILNPVSIHRINQDSLNKGGIYPQSGALFIDRAVVLSNSLSVSSITVSSINVTGAEQVSTLIASSITVSSINITGAGQFSTISGSSLTVSSINVTGSLQVPNGVNAGDAAAFGQLSTFKLVCSSTTAELRSTTGAAFVISPLGCSGALGTSSHHALVLANPELRNTTAGNITEGAIFVDGVNQDDASQGQCQVINAAAIADNRISCHILLYYAPGNTTSHTYQFYFGNSGGTQQFFSTTARMLVFEVP